MVRLTPRLFCPGKSGAGLTRFFFLIHWLCYQTKSKTMEEGREVMESAAEENFKDAIQNVEVAQTPEERAAALEEAAAAAEEIEDEEKKAAALVQVELLR